MAKTLFDKIWDRHVITELGNGFVLMHIDRLLLHDMSGGKALKEATVEKGYAPAQPRLRRDTRSAQLCPHDDDGSACRRRCRPHFDAVPVPCARGL